MTKRISTKYKLDRRVGENIWGRPKSPVNKRKYGPGQHGPGKRSTLSSYGLQLRAKQKLKGYYGNISEKQFKNTYKHAANMKGDTSQNLINLLERRLDAVIYRMKFAITPFAARQLINHGHVCVNGKRVNIPSYRVSENDEITIKNTMVSNVKYLESINTKERDVPSYMDVDLESGRGKLLQIPSFEMIPYACQMEPKLVVEFYSK